MPNKGVYTLLNSSEIARTRWLRLVQLEYSNGDTVHKWDSVERAHNGVDSKDVVVVSAIVRSKNRPIETLLVKQWRPPVGRFTIEFPAGLVDKGETAQQAALRELKEETGYVCERVLSISEPLPLSPGITNECARMVTVEIDSDRPENVNPVQQTEETEDIEVIRVPLKRLAEELKSLEALGNLVFSGVHAVAHGLHLAQIINNIDKNEAKSMTSDYHQ